MESYKSPSASNLNSTIHHPFEDVRWSPICIGRLSTHELAPAFVAEVARLFHRYVEEIVMRYALCPFLKEMESGVGSLLIFLDDKPCVDTAVEAVCNSTTSVTHLMYPLLSLRPEEFERFGSSIHHAVNKRMDEAPVHATFHPELAGATDCPYRFIGLLRHSPDPFVQFIPGNIQKVNSPTIDNPDRLFRELVGETRDILLNTLEDIKADRDKAYARFRTAFGLSDNQSDVA